MRQRGRALLTATIASACAVACGLSTTGKGGPFEDVVGDTSGGAEGGAMQADGAVVGGGEGGSMPGADGSASEAGTTNNDGGAGDGGTTGNDAGTTDGGAVNPCTAGVTLPIAASSLRLVGDATYDASKKRVVLTPGANDKAGAAWISPSLYPNATGSVSFDIDISGGTTGEGIAFAWVTTTGAAPTVGANGRSFGLCSGGMSNASGYGVIVDTDDGSHATTLRIVSIVLGSCTTLNAASTGNNGSMSHVDDGKPHTLTVAWTGTQMSAILGSPSLSTSAIVAHPFTPLTLGFTAATGSSTSSVQAVENISWATTCN
jgi:hypothetical protein